ncbi:MAG: hypothetical protein HY560_11320, partial [Gemmatimonadetes bacterium]|nr:hypothetical protein [Gemmatimonadota bacterium]
MAGPAALAIVALMAAALRGNALAQAPDSARAGGPATTTIVAGARYGRAWLHRILWGPHYRDLWTRPISVPLLDLKTYAGGLTPTTAGGRFQSRSLRFRTGEGREFSFRLVDKNPVSILPPELRQTVAADIVQDQ